MCSQSKMYIKMWHNTRETIQLSDLANAFQRVSYIKYFERTNWDAFGDSTKWIQRNKSICKFLQDETIAHFSARMARTLCISPTLTPTPPLPDTRFVSGVLSLLPRANKPSHCTVNRRQYDVTQSPKLVKAISQTRQNCLVCVASASTVWTGQLPTTQDCRRQKIRSLDTFRAVVQFTPPYDTR